MQRKKLSTYPQKERRKKVAKKEERKTTTTIFCQPFLGRESNFCLLSSVFCPLSSVQFLRLFTLSKIYHLNFYFFCLFFI
jgi:hypothetical protein